MRSKIIYDFNTTNIILKLYSEGLSISKIVKKLGLTTTPVKNIIKNLEFIPWQENIKKEQNVL